MQVALIGFGEVGSTLADDLAPHGQLSAWDVKFADAASKPSRSLASRTVRKATSAGANVFDGALIISAVTAAQTENAARDCAASLVPGAFYLDLNSASPGAKAIAAQAVNEAGGRYIEASVMSPIAPKRIASPILLGGPHAEEALPVLQDLGFSGTRLFASEYGKAAAAKLCRSVMVKGLEALVTESLIAARHYGVEQTVLASLEDMFPAGDWPERSRYLISRALEHGVRRAEEMREAARTVSEAGLDPLMSTATAARQDAAAHYAAALDTPDLEHMLDAIAAQIKRESAA